MATDFKYALEIFCLFILSSKLNFEIVIIFWLPVRKLMFNACQKPDLLPESDIKGRTGVSVVLPWL